MVDGVSFTVAAGEIVGLIGLNGAGKTSLIDCIAGLARPDAGLVIVAGHAPGCMVWLWMNAWRRRWGWVRWPVAAWTDCRAGRSSGWRWRWPCNRARRHWFWMNRPQRLIR